MSVRVKGTLYKENYVLVIKNDQNIEFGKIQFILISNDNTVYFLYNKLHMRKKEKHLGAFCIEETEHLGVINQNDLNFYCPTVINNFSDDKKYVVLRMCN